MKFTPAELEEARRRGMVKGDGVYHVGGTGKKAPANGAGHHERPEAHKGHHGGKKANAGRIGAAILTGGASELLRAAGGKKGRGKRRGVFGELLHDVGNTKGLGRVALALATGGGSEVARLTAHEAEKMIHGPGSPHPSRRNLGRLAHRLTPAHGRAVEAATAAVEGREPRKAPPVPHGRIHPQRRLAARARHGFYKHMNEGDLQ